MASPWRSFAIRPMTTHRHRLTGAALEPFIEDGALSAQSAAAPWQGEAGQLVTATSATPRIATVDWTIAETLLALGVTPMAVGMWPPYRAWSVNPSFLPGDGYRAACPTQPGTAGGAQTGSYSHLAAGGPGADPLPHRAGALHHPCMNRAPICGSDCGKRPGP